MERREKRHKKHTVNKKKIIKKHVSPIVRQFKNFVLRKATEFPCNHNLVGSSNFLRFLKGKYNPSRAHGVIRSQTNQAIGRVGENAYGSSVDNFLYQPFSISKRFPFLCSTSDFILIAPNPILIEIKTSQNLETCKEMFENVRNEHLFQILTSLEVYGLRKAHLLIYYYDEHSNKRNKYGYGKWVTLYGRIFITVKKDFFANELGFKAIEKYIDFLRLYYESMSLKASQKDLKIIQQMLTKTMNTHKRLLTSYTTIRNLPIKRQSPILSDLCLELAGADPDDERFGPKETKVFEQKVYKDVKKNLAIQKIQKTKKKVREKRLDLDSFDVEHAFKCKED